MKYIIYFFLCSINFSIHPVTAQKSDSTYNSAAWLLYKNGYVILNSLPDTTWFEGAPTSINESDPGDVTCEVNINKIPQKYKHLLGKEVELISRENASQIIKIKRLMIYGSTTPSIGVLEEWHPKFKQNDSTKLPHTTEETARFFFELAKKSDGLYLVAEIEHVINNNIDIGYIFREKQNNNVNLLYETYPNSPGIKETKNKIFASFKKYLGTTLQREYLKERKCYGNKSYTWWGHPQTEKEWHFFTNGKGSLFVSLKIALVEGCTCQTFSITSIWELKPKEPVLLWSTQDRVKILDILNFTKSKSFEFIIEAKTPNDGENLRILRKNKKWEEEFLFNVPFLDCGC